MHVSSLLMVESFEETIADEIELIFPLRSMIQAELRTKLSNDVQLLFRCLDLINEYRKNVSLRESVITGARFFYLNLLLEPRRSIVFDEWLRSQNNAFNDECFHLPETTDDQLFTLIDGQLVLEDTKVRVACRNAHDFPQRLDEFRKKFVICPTLIEQIAQVFAAASARTALLLEGGPGIGKTQVVLQVCSLLGVECERMNLSGHTSLEQLIGCFMPRFVNGARVFQWHEGRLISAIRAERWILLDELNLASNDVLQALTPLFYRSATTFTLHATGERLSLANVRIFATMNPSSTP
jgi:hypothetical protein